MDDQVAAHFEPGVASPSYRLSILAHLKAAGIPAGMFLMPLIPGVSDSEPALHQAFQAACEAGLDYVVASGMTLTVGRQRDHFLGELGAYDSSLVPLYERMYGDDRWGSPRGPEAQTRAALLRSVGAQYPIAKRIPAALFPTTLPPHLRIQVALEQVVQLTQEQGARTRFKEALRNVREMTPGSEVSLAQVTEGMASDVSAVAGAIWSGDRSELYEQALQGGAWL
mgnify:CR=1 FL=1